MCARMCRGYMELSILSAPFLCTSKTVLKNKAYYNTVSVQLLACQEDPQGTGQLPMHSPCELLEHRALCELLHGWAPQSQASPW